ncbi:islet cell autoantigen 1 [Aphidius gifuensis]|uniref:islet cell autoantigen 1 n=1 Tax=Aphidius gifuensis TaxID=684658 RepID=UPI001CDCE5E3|nr:islet cell autoantigen 1 [Aphidius gifuensis]
MNTYDRGGPGVSGNSFDRWVQRSDVSNESPMTKMQHQYWLTKQTLSRKLGKKEDECIVSSDAELDAKLELFRSIQDSCCYLQRVIDKYQERLCNLAQEENTMGRFLKEAGKQDKTRAGKMMSAVGKSLSYSGQQRIALRSPLVRLYQEVETFRQRAIEDTLQNVQSMEKARTEYRAALSWMKNISQELDPDTTKQLERFRKVQIRVRRGKELFDNQAFDCLQKIDLLAAARCSMFSHALVLYQSTLLTFTKKSSQAYSTIANSFKGYQRYDFTVVKELADTSIKLAKETSGNNDDDGGAAGGTADADQDDDDDKDKLLFFDSEFHDNIEEAQEAKTIDDNSNNKDEKLLDINYDESKNIQKKIDSTLNDNKKPSDKVLDDFFLTLNDKKKIINNDIENNLAKLDLEMDSFIANTNEIFDFTSAPIVDQSTSSDKNQFEFLANENMTLLDDILTNDSTGNAEWDAFTKESFLPAGILKQSLGDVTLCKNQMKTKSFNDEKKKDKLKGKNNSWLDLFAELDPLANNPIESLSKSNDNNAPA